jgi:DNA-binding SARP family transcriptional activator
LAEDSHAQRQCSVKESVNRCGPSVKNAARASKTGAGVKKSDRWPMQAVRSRARQMPPKRLLYRNERDLGHARQGRPAQGGLVMQAISRIRLHLLGRFAPFPARAPDQPLPISSRKGCALLAYLAMQPEPMQTREQLATLLWGDRFDKQARQSLRQCLLSLRRELEHVAPGLLVFDGEVVGLNAELFSTDAREFAALAEESGDPQRALVLYRGEFLAGFSLDVEPFDDWVRGERARFAAMAARLLELQAAQSDEGGHGEQALRACERLLALDPLREDWQRLALKLTARHRGRDAAMARANALIALLRSELDANPEPATATLIDDIKRGTIAPASQTRSPKSIVLAPRDACSPVVAAPVPLAAERAADALTRVEAPLAPEPSAAAPSWRSQIPHIWPLAALACVAALAIAVSWVWLLAPPQSVSVSVDHQSGPVRTSARAALPTDTSRTSLNPPPASADMGGPAARADEPAIDALIAKGWAAHNRGWTLENLTEAMAAFQAAHQRDGDLPDAMLGIAAVSITLVTNLLIAESAPYLDQAEGLLQRALRERPDDTTILYQLGRLYLARGQYEAALGMVAHVLERVQVYPYPFGSLNSGKPSLPYVHALMGHILVRSGRATEGIGHIRHAIQLRPHSPIIGNWCVFAGEAELELGQTGAALEWLLRALAVLPSGDAPVHQALAATYALRGDHANAAKHAVEFRTILPEARIASLCKQYPVRLREGLLLALELSNPDKQP